jgi:glycosyltransferase involved in cell wall biosynthesis
MTPVPPVSVVMCAFNAAPFIGRAIESIRAQTFVDFELIVVDDGSTDATASILETHARADARVRPIAVPHQGISAAANTGIAAARGAWIARADADDIALPHRLERQLGAAAAEPRVVLWGSYAAHINDREVVLGLSRTGPRTTVEFAQQRAAGEDGFVLQPTWLVRKDVLVAAGGYDLAFECGEDVDLLDRIAEFGPTLTIPEPLVCYRVHTGSISMTRFALMRRHTRYVNARRRARLAGATLTRVEHEAKERARPMRVRAAGALQTASAYAYRSAGVRFAAGARLSAVGWFAAAAVLNPSYALRRVWAQVLSAPARRLRSA